MLPLTVLEERIGYTFKNKELLRRAMTHRSFSAEHNERLEFLGDSVLNCVIGNALFLKDKHFEEAQTVIIRLYEPMLSQLTPTTLGKDAKTNLQEVLQRMHYGLPLYDIVEIRGAPHDQEFEVRVDIPDLGISLTGVGKSRRQAEQDAAQKALDSEAIRNLKG